MVFDEGGGVDCGSVDGGWVFVYYLVWGVEGEVEEFSEWVGGWEDGWWVWGVGWRGECWDCDDGCGG